MFISARTERIALTRSTTQPISASASALSSPSCAGHSVSASSAARVRRDAPQLLGDERHERMQQLQRLVAHPGDHGARLGLGRAVRAGQHGLRELQIPVAVDVPDEAIGRAGRLVEAIALDRRGDLARRLGKLVPDPLVQRLGRKPRIEAGHQRRAVHLAEARRVPELGREIAIALDALRRELDVAALCGHGGKREAQRVRAVVVDQVQRIDDVALRLRHLGAALVAHQRVDVDVGERHLPS